MMDDAPYNKVVLNKNEKSEIRIYNGDEDTNKLNRKRIGVFLFINDNFIVSKWIECGKLIKNTLVNNPKMTNAKKSELTDEAINELKIVWENMLTVQWDDICET